MNQSDISMLTDKVAGLILNSKRLVVFTGAGISTESGIPDFRSPGGIWDRFDPEDFTIGNFVKDSDVFGADALLQFTDILIGINRPAKYGLPFYGPDKIPVDLDTLAVHFLKVRNGEPCLTLFKADFAKSKIHQIF